jgi:Lipase (class 3)
MDLNKAILYGQLVNAAYAVSTSDLSNKAGSTISAGLASNKTNFEVVTSIYANDLATDLLPSRGTKRVSIGLVFRAAATGEAVIAIRGTEGILEWVEDASFLTVKCPFLANGGQTEDGFTAMYNSLAAVPTAGSPSLTKSLAALVKGAPVSSLTICGHSLGGALATLLALDVAANTEFKNPTVYTYASPRTGDGQFVEVYNQTVPNTFRIANTVDLVPKLPLSPPYDHVQAEYKLKAFQFFPPKVLVEPNPACEHILETYLHLLSKLAGGEVLALRQGCDSPAGLVQFWGHLGMEFRGVGHLKKEQFKGAEAVLEGKS